MVHDDVLVVPRNLLICFMSSLSLCVLWLFGRSGGTGAQIPHVRLHGRCSKTELELCIAGMCICSMFGPALPIKTKKRVFEIKAKAARSRPLGLPRSPRTEWEGSRRPPAKMRQSG